jgi:hypothetical protein
MKTLTVQAEVTDDHMLRLEIPCDIPPGQVDVILTIQTRPGPPLADSFAWDKLRGLGRDVWERVDAVTYVQGLRADRETPR